MKGSAVNCMHTRNTQRMRRTTPENARLGTMRMNEIRLVVTELLFDGKIRFGVIEWIQISVKLWQNSNIQLPHSGTVNQSTFGPRSRSGDEANLVSVQVVLIFNAEECVLLGATNNQSCDEMGDSHGGFDYSQSGRRVEIVGRFKMNEWKVFEDLHRNNKAWCTVDVRGRVRVLHQ